MTIVMWDQLQIHHLRCGQRKVVYRNHRYICGVHVQFQEMGQSVCVEGHIVYVDVGVLDA